MGGFATLNNDRLSIRVSPRGGALVDGHTVGGKPFLRPYDGSEEAFSIRHAACFPMVPFCNRVGGNHFTYEGRVYETAPNATDPLFIHGDGWLGTWDIARHAEDRIVLDFAHDGKEGSPHAYHASQAIALEGATLKLTVKIENTGDHPMPFGLGFHPYFPRTADTLVEAPAGSWWTKGPGLLPGEAQAPPAEVDFSTAKPLPGFLVDNCFEGWNGKARISWPERDLAVRFEVDDVYDRYMLYAPGPDFGFFCLEPMSHTANGFHMADCGGLTRLAPAERLSGSFAIIVEEDSANG